MSGAEHQAALATLAPFADLGLQANCNPLQSLFPSGLRVLAVDDDPVCLTVVEQMLRKCSYLVTTAPNGTTALQLLRDRAAEFDLVLSDVYMPDMDGFKLLEIIGLEMDLPVIMMSSNGETNQVLRGVTHGACDFLIKPVRIEELRNMWQHVVRRKRLQGGTGDLDSDEQSQEKEEDVSRKRKDYCGNSLGLVSGSGFQLETQRDEDGNAAKKPRVVWSVEMHQQFVNAVNQLGIDKAVPKKILEIMNVDGLTRENVASHLQKYRLYLKRVAGVQPSAPSKSKPAGAAANTSAAAASQPAAAPIAAGSVTAATAASPGAPAGATPHASQPGSGTPAVPSLPAGPSTAGLTQQGSQQLPQLQPGAPTSNGLHTSAAQQPLDAANLGNAAAFPNPLLANPMAAVMGGAGLNPLLGLQGLGALGPMMNPLGLPTMQAPIGLLPGLTGSMPGPGGQGLMPMGLPGLAPMPGMLAGMPGMPFMQGLNPMAGLGQMQGVAVAGGVNMPGTMAMQQQMAANAGANGIGAFGMPATGMAPAAATTAGLQQPTLQVGAQQAQTLQQQPQAQQQLQPAQPQQQQQQPADPATSFTLLSEVDFCVGPGPLQAVPATSDGLLGVDNNSDLAAVFNDLYNGGGPSTVALVGDGPLDQKADDDFFNFLLKN